MFPIQARALYQSRSDAHYDTNLLPDTSARTADDFPNVRPAYYSFRLCLIKTSRYSGKSCSRKARNKLLFHLHRHVPHSWRHQRAASPPYRQEHQNWFDTIRCLHKGAHRYVLFSRKPFSRSSVLQLHSAGRYSYRMDRKSPSRAE